MPHLQFKPSKSHSPKNSKAPFTVSNSQPISLLPTLSKLLERIVFDQKQCYFTVNKLTTDFQHVYREGHSTALTQMIGWEKLMIKRLWGLFFSTSVWLLTLSSLLLENRMCYGFTPAAILWIKSYLSNRTQCVLFNGSLTNIIQVESGIPQGSCLSH